MEDGRDLVGAEAEAERNPPPMWEGGSPHLKTLTHLRLHYTLKNSKRLSLSKASESLFRQMQISYCYPFQAVL